MKANAEIGEARTGTQNPIFGAESIGRLQNSDGSELMLRKGFLN